MSWPARLIRMIQSSRMHVHNLTPVNSLGLRPRLPYRGLIVHRSSIAKLHTETHGTQDAPKIKSRPALLQESRSRSREKVSTIIDLDLAKIEVPALGTSNDLSSINIDRPGLSSLKIHRNWLRDACTCNSCVDPSSGQKRFSTLDVPDQLPMSNARLNDDGSFEVQWESDFFTHDTHTSRYPASLFSLHSLIHLPKNRLWNRASLELDNRFFDYDEFMSGGQEYVSAMSGLRRNGIVFLRGVPAIEGAVENIAAKIGIIQETFYGRTWDVTSKVDAENVAYTSSYLGLHQDLLYMTEVPQLQILHCLENTCEGGESLFSDGLRAHTQMELELPHMAEALHSRLIKYHYCRGNHSYSQHRPLMGKRNTWWSPPFQAPQQRTAWPPNAVDRYESWLQAARKLRMYLEDDEYVYQYKMRPTECVIFDNLRVLHGRRQFDTSSGERWLKGTYIETSSYVSTLVSLFEDRPIDDLPTLSTQARIFSWSKRTKRESTLSHEETGVKPN